MKLNIRAKTFRHALDWIDLIKHFHPKYYKRYVVNAQISIKEVP